MFYYVDYITSHWYVPDSFIILTRDFFLSFFVILQSTQTNSDLPFVINKVYFHLNNLLAELTPWKVSNNFIIVFDRWYCSAIFHQYQQKYFAKLYKECLDRVYCLWLKMATLTFQSISTEHLSAIASPLPLFNETLRKMILPSKSNLISIYVLKVSNKNTNIRWDIYSKSTIKAAEWHQLTSGKILFLPTPLILIKCSENIWCVARFVTICTI